MIDFLYQSQHIQNVKPEEILKLAHRIGMIQAVGNIITKETDIEPFNEMLPWIHSFWVVLSFMPDSSSFLTMQYPFTYSFHVRGKLVEVAYFSSGEEERLNASIKQFPIGTKDSIRRIAVLESLSRIDSITETGFTHFCYVVPGKDGLSKVKTVSQEQAWKEESAP